MSTLPHLQKNCRALYVKLTQLRLHKLAVERNLQHKADIYEFPEQFRAGIPRINGIYAITL